MATQANSSNFTVSSIVHGSVTYTNFNTHACYYQNIRTIIQDENNPNRFISGVTNKAIPDKDKAAMILPS